MQTEQMCYMLTVPCPLALHTDLMDWYQENSYPRELVPSRTGTQKIGYEFSWRSRTSRRSRTHQHMGTSSPEEKLKSFYQKENLGTSSPWRKKNFVISAMAISGYEFSWTRNCQFHHLGTSSLGENYQIEIWERVLLNKTKLCYFCHKNLSNLS